jgi:hypothetical protein
MLGRHFKTSKAYRRKKRLHAVCVQADDGKIKVVAWCSNRRDAEQTAQSTGLNLRVVSGYL